MQTADYIFCFFRLISVEMCNSSYIMKSYKLKNHEIIHNQIKNHKS